MNTEGSNNAFHRFSYRFARQLTLSSSCSRQVRKWFAIFNFITLSFLICIASTSFCTVSAGESWVLKNVDIQKHESPLPGGCVTSQSYSVGDGSASFSRTYSQCQYPPTYNISGTGVCNVAWQSPPSILQPAGLYEPAVSLSISHPPNWGADCGLVFYRGSQSDSVHPSLGHSDPHDEPHSWSGKLSLTMPQGSIGNKSTFWFNPHGDSGSGDVFYTYEYESTADPSILGNHKDLAGGPGDNPQTAHIPPYTCPARQGLPDFTVNTSLLSLVISDMDFGYQSQGLDESLRRIWNMMPEKKGMFGNGWSFAFESTLTAEPYLKGVGALLTVVRGSGQEIEYTLISANSHEAGHTPDHERH